VNAYTVTLGLAALGCIFIATTWWATVLVLLVAALFTPHHLFTYRPPRVLHVEGWDGGWHIEHLGRVDAACLQHVWHGPSWTTLKFKKIASGKILYLTLWRGEVSSPGWRLLRQLVSRGNKPLGPRTETQ
jgi:hypothetical protein